MTTTESQEDRIRMVRSWLIAREVRNAKLRAYKKLAKTYPGEFLGLIKERLKIQGLGEEEIATQIVKVRESLEK